MKGSAATSLLVGLLAFTAGVWLGQAPNTEEYPGNYPLFEPPLEGVIERAPDHVRITLASGTKSGRVIVFAYADAETMYGLLKPIENGAVTVSDGDRADFLVRTRGTEALGVEFLKRMDRYVADYDMRQGIDAAAGAGRRFGVQRCLFPICNRCTDGCRTVVRGDDLPITLHVRPTGQIHPVFAKGKCPRCGKCFVWCPSGVITMTPSLVG